VYAAELWSLAVHEVDERMAATFARLFGTPP
jgi:hypothetical protein